jgi:hypothetical protein
MSSTEFIYHGRRHYVRRVDAYGLYWASLREGGDEAPFRYNDETGKYHSAKREISRVTRKRRPLSSRRRNALLRTLAQERSQADRLTVDVLRSPNTPQEYIEGAVSAYRSLSGLDISASPWAPTLSSSSSSSSSVPPQPRGKGRGRRRVPFPSRDPTSVHTELQRQLAILAITPANQLPPVLRAVAEENGLRIDVEFDSENYLNGVADVYRLLWYTQ